MNGKRSILVGAVTGMVALVLLAACAGDTPEEMVASAKAYLAKNDRNAAVIQLKNALQRNPDIPEARFLLGKASFEAGDSAAAEKELRKAAELRYPIDQVAPVLARVMVSRGQFKKAIDEFGKTDVASPKERADLQTTLAEANLALQDSVAARRGFESALAAIPDYPPALLGTARLKAMGGDLPGAVASVEKALAGSPTLTEGWQMMGDLMRSQSKLEPALAAYRKAVETKADYVPAHAMIVSLLMGDLKTEESNKALDAMKKVAPGHPQTLYLQALAALRDKNYPAARDAIQLSLKAAPNNLRSMLLSAQIDFQLGSYGQTEATLNTVLQRFPNQGLARRLLVRTYLLQGKPNKARDTLQPALQVTQIDSDTLSLAGEVYLQIGDASTAAGYFEKAAALDPKNTAKRASAAVLHMARGESERGVGELEAIAAKILESGRNWR